MERLLLNNAVKAKYVIGGMFFGSMFIHQWWFRHSLVYYDVFGFDGNGGNMIKIITELTDEEMARLKYVRRLYWHWKGSRQTFDGRDTISA